jgi:hypothetical protein
MKKILLASVALVAMSAPAWAWHYNVCNKTVANFGTSVTYTTPILLEITMSYNGDTATTTFNPPLKTGNCQEVGTIDYEPSGIGPATAVTFKSLYGGGDSNGFGPNYTFSGPAMDTSKDHTITVTTTSNMCGMRRCALPLVVGYSP